MPAESTGQVCLFWKLPQELRDEIHYHVGSAIPDSDPEAIINGGTTRSGFGSALRGLIRGTFETLTLLWMLCVKHNLMVSKQYIREALPILVRATTFRVRESDVGFLTDAINCSRLLEANITSIALDCKCYWIGPRKISSEAVNACPRLIDLTAILPGFVNEDVLSVRLQHVELLTRDVRGLKRFSFVWERLRQRQDEQCGADLDIVRDLGDLIREAVTQPRVVESSNRVMSLFV